MADGETTRPPATKTRRAFEVVYDKVRSDLASGLLKTGDKLPAERDLAEQLGFSRSAVREALRALEATGLIQLQKGVTGGAFIRSGDPETVSRSINDIIVLGKIPLRDVMEVRALLLGRAVQLVCERGKATDLDRIAQNIDDTEAAANARARLEDHVRAFYSLLGEISGNEVLAMLIDATTSISLNFVFSHKIEFTTELLVLRRNVLARLRARDADGASRAISENLAFLHGYVVARAAAH
ncbi:GntR family transcriptional regulator [Phenylobacterium sp.]|uniref:FadR/GntR family transcriptional regulator n=1 Tax=Phenylobacterium sp. TaxID=1871053 RepID=UPI0025F49FC3|nr:GntR family transcriptional regulator [Phenylobacterium sp.]